MPNQLNCICFILPFWIWFRFLIWHGSSGLIIRASAWELVLPIWAALNWKLAEIKLWLHLVSVTNAYDSHRLGHQALTPVGLKHLFSKIYLDVFRRVHLDPQILYRRYLSTTIIYLLQVSSQIWSEWLVHYQRLSGQLPPQYLNFEPSEKRPAITRASLNHKMGLNHAMWTRFQWWL